MDYFKGKGHKQFTATYLQLLDLIVQFCFEQEMLLDDPIIDSVFRLSTGLSRWGSLIYNPYITIYNQNYSLTLKLSYILIATAYSK